MHLKDMPAVVTGAGKGIGRAIALALAREGAKVALAARTETEIQEAAREITSAGGSALAIRADLTIEEDIKRLIHQAEATHGPTEILVNNAGILELVRIVDTPTEVWDRAISVNLRAAFLACREVLPGMIERRSGRIINIASSAGRRGYVEQGAYSVSKHGLIGLSKVLALETQPYGIRVHVISPGGVLTDLSKGLRESRGKVNESEWMSPEEVAQAVLYLCSQDGPAMTDELVLRRYLSEPWR